MVDSVGLEVVPHGFVVPLKVLKNGSSVKEKIRVWALLKLFCLGVSFESKVQLFGFCFVLEEVGQVGISKDIPTFAVSDILHDSLVSKGDAPLESFLLLLSTRVLLHPQDHREAPQSVQVCLILLKTPLITPDGIGMLVLLPVNMG
jgi:hypothetical protein